MLKSDLESSTYWLRLAAALLNLVAIAFACVAVLGSKPQVTLSLAINIMILGVPSFWLVAGVMLLGRYTKQDLSSTISAVCVLAILSGLTIGIWVFKSLTHGGRTYQGLGNDMPFAFTMALLIQIPCGPVAFVAGVLEWLRRTAVTRGVNLSEQSSD